MKWKKGIALLLASCGVYSSGSSVAGDRIRERIEGVVEKAKQDALKEAIEAEFEVADSNEDGSLSVEEFTHYLIKEDHFNPSSSSSRKRKHIKKSEGKWLGEESNNVQDEDDKPTRVKEIPPIRSERPIIDEVVRLQDPERTREVSKSSAGAFWSTLVNSILMIVVTELGDKTFFIAALMAMKNSRIVVYAGAMGALAVMTVLSAIIGSALPALLPKTYTHYGAACLFVFFGFKMLKEAYEMYLEPPTSNEELEEAEEEINSKFKGKDDDGLESGRRSPSAMQQQKYAREVKVLASSFTMTFLAEWGDRSQIATVALATTKGAVAVSVGAVIGHAMCTGLAVVGGRLLATSISEFHVQVSGGVLFCVFALHSFIVGPE